MGGQLVSCIIIIIQVWWVSWLVVESSNRICEASELVFQMLINKSFELYFHFLGKTDF